VPTLCLPCAYPVPTLFLPLPHTAHPTPHRPPYPHPTPTLPHPWLLTLASLR
jgi:hypothetical protein